MTRGALPVSGRCVAVRIESRKRFEITPASLHFASRRVRGGEREEKASARFGRDDKLWNRGHGAQRCCARTNSAATSARLAGPVGAVVPVDAVATAGDDAGDDCTGPIRCELTARIPRTGRCGVGFGGDAVGVAATTNVAAL